MVWTSWQINGDPDHFRQTLINEISRFDVKTLSTSFRMDRLFQAQTRPAVSTASGDLILASQLSRVDSSCMTLIREGGPGTGPPRRSVPSALLTQNLTDKSTNPRRSMLGLQRKEVAGFFKRKSGKRFNSVLNAICASIRASGAPKQK